MLGYQKLTAFKVLTAVYSIYGLDSTGLLVEEKKCDAAFPRQKRDCASSDSSDYLLTVVPSGTSATPKVSLMRILRKMDMHARSFARAGFLLEKW